MWKAMVELVAIVAVVLDFWSGLFCGNGWKLRFVFELIEVLDEDLIRAGSSSGRSISFSTAFHRGVSHNTIVMLCTLPTAKRSAFLETSEREQMIAL